jgi:hypothetical protein
MLEAFRSNELTWRSSWVKGPPFGPKWVQTDRNAVIFPCLTLSLYLAHEPKIRLQELTERMPPLKNIEMFSAIAETVPSGQRTTSSSPSPAYVTLVRLADRLRRVQSAR